MWFACHVSLANSNKQFIVDPWKFEEVRRHKWHLSSDGKTIMARIDGESVTIGRFLLGIINPKKVADHFDRSIYNNLMINLREVTYSQNNCNRSIKRNATSKFRGVFERKDRGYYRANININGKTIDLGKFSREEDAARAFDKAALKYHGEWAQLNFPEETNG